MLLICLLIAVISVFVWLWLYNKKKYNNLKHQIPANVVKNYLDSIIQNSTALKSSLFRGGGLDTDTSSLPSVLPLADLPGGSQVSVDSSDATELKALIASLETKLHEKTQITNQLETDNAGLRGELTTKDETIDELEVIIASLRNSGADEASNEESNQAVEILESEVLSLKEQLQEYEVISADIANMKRLKEENAQLKESLKEFENLAADTESIDDIDVTDDLEDVDLDEVLDESIEEVKAEELDEEPEVEEVVAQEPELEEPQIEDVKEADETQEVVSEQENINEDEPEEVEEDKKSPEDLLSEFEKMLG